MTDREGLKPFLDGEENGAVRAEIERLLRSDPEIRREARQLQSISEALRDEQPIAVRGREELLSRLQLAPHRSRVGIPRLTWAFGIASVILLIGLSVWPHPRRQFAMQTAVYSPPVLPVTPSPLLEFDRNVAPAAAAVPRQPSTFTLAVDDPQSARRALTALALRLGGQMESLDRAERFVPKENFRVSLPESNAKTFWRGVAKLLPPDASKAFVTPSSSSRPAGRAEERVFISFTIQRR